MLRGFHPAILRSLEGQRVSAYLMSYPQATAAAGEQPSETRGRLDFVLRETAPGTLALQATLTPDLAPNKRVTLEVTSATPEDYRSVLGPERVEKQLGKLGTTAYYPGEIQINTEVRAPVSWLNALRRELIAALDEQLASSDTDEVPSAPTSSPAHTHTATVRQPTATLTPAPTSSAQPDSAQPPSARTTERLLDYLSWRGGRIDREVLARLTAEPDASPEAPQLDLLLLPGQDLDPREALQLWTWGPELRRFDINLHDLCRVPLANILHLSCDGQSVLCQLIRRPLHLSQLEAAVGQPIAEGIEDLFLREAIGPLVHGIVRELRQIVVRAVEGQRQLALR